jgi:two-component system KDP operon response regulator KdpE
MTKMVNETRNRILVIDDDVKLLSFVAKQLREQDYRVETSIDGKDGLDKAASFSPELIILDLTMPGMDGIETLSRLRQWHTGAILILSATHEENKKVEALDLGADDYLTKPFGMQELLARVRSGLRRITQTGAQDTGSAVIEMDDLKIDMAHRIVTRDGSEVNLTRTEYELLRILASNPGKVMTHRELLHEVWGPEFGGETEYLRTYVKQLRRKLEKNPSRPERLKTQPGIGYRFVAE